MTGDNEMMLNQDTMCEALQYYFEEILFSKGNVPTIKSIEQNTNGAYANARTFKVLVSNVGKVVTTA